MNTASRAYSYIRFSTLQQAEGDSLRRQTELSLKYAERHGLSLDTSLSFQDLGLSGFTGENRSKGALALFLHAVQTGLVSRGSFLLVESLDRLSRDTLSEQMTLFIGLINAGLTVVTLADQQAYNKATVDQDLSKLMLSLVVMMRAHEESLTKSRRLKAAWENKRKQASDKKLTSSCPSWLSLAPDRRAFVVIPERAALVRRIFGMSLNGDGIARIARNLNSEGISNWSRGRGWHASFVHRLLRSRAVLGEYQPMRRNGAQSVLAGDPIRDYYPAILDEDTWREAQTRRQTRPRCCVGKHFVNLFSGIVFDGFNGTSMRLIQWDHSKGAFDSSDRGYYLVSDYSRLTKDRRSVSWRYSWLEKWVLDDLTNLDWRSLCEEREISERRDLETQIQCSKEISLRKTKELERLMALAKSTDSPPQSLLQEMRLLDDQQSSLRGRRADLEKRMETLAAKEASLYSKRDLIKELASQPEEHSRIRLRLAIRDRVKRIDLFPGGTAEWQCADGPKASLVSPSIKLTFLNGIVRWVCCLSRNPFELRRKVADAVPSTVRPRTAQDFGVSTRLRANTTTG